MERGYGLTKGESGGDVRGNASQFAAPFLTKLVPGQIMSAVQ